MFCRPVDHSFPIKHDYGERGKKHDWSIDPDNGLWIPVKDRDGLGHHHGTDFDCPSGTMVRAMADGIIVRARYESAVDPSVGPGLYILQLVMLPGFDSWGLRYSHLKAVYVSPGKKVNRFDPIAESGDTGDAECAYLHTDLMNLKRQWRPIPLDPE